MIEFVEIIDSWEIIGNNIYALLSIQGVNGINKSFKLTLSLSCAHTKLLLFTIGITLLAQVSSKKDNTSSNSKRQEIEVNDKVK